MVITQNTVSRKPSQMYVQIHHDICPRSSSIMSGSKGVQSNKKYHENANHSLQPLKEICMAILGIWAILQNRFTNDKCLGNSHPLIQEMSTTHLQYHKNNWKGRKKWAESDYLLSRHYRNTKLFSLNNIASTNNNYLWQVCLVMHSNGKFIYYTVTRQKSFCSILLLKYSNKCCLTLRGEPSIISTILVVSVSESTM